MDESVDNSQTGEIFSNETEQSFNTDFDKELKERQRAQSTSSMDDSSYPSETGEISSSETKENFNAEFDKELKELQGGPLSSDDSNYGPDFSNFTRDTTNESCSGITFDKGSTAEVTDSPAAGNEPANQNELANKKKSMKLNVSSSNSVSANQEEWYVYMLMELCDRVSLRHWLQNNMERPKPLIHKFFLDIVRAIEYLHDKNHIHRDLKPSNILFSLHDENTLKIGDFGLGTTISESEVFEPCTPDTDNTKLLNNNQRTRNAGTRAYMSPEVENGTVYDYKVDIFSMGLILFEMTWVMRTDQEKYRLLSDVRKSIFPEKFAELHPEEHALLLLMLNKDPALRPSTRGIRAMLPLSRIQSQEEVESIKESEHFNLPKRHRRNTSAGSNSLFNIPSAPSLDIED